MKLDIKIATIEIEKIYQTYDMSSQKEMTEACNLIDYWLEMAGCSMLDYTEHISGATKLN